jgi:hypothetical protein
MISAAKCVVLIFLFLVWSQYVMIEFVSMPKKQSFPFKPFKFVLKAKKYVEQGQESVGSKGS